jgi:hypothetical protein
MITLNTDASSGITEIRIKGDVTDADIQATAQKLADEHEAKGRVLVLETVEQVGEVEPSFVWEDLKRLIVHDDPKGKAAIVTDERWKTWFNELLVPYVGENVRLFNHDQRHLARRWLRGDEDHGTPLSDAPDDVNR